MKVGGKFYDCVGGSKSFLGEVNSQDESRRLLNKLWAGWWADINDVEGIRQLFVDAAARRTSLATSFQPYLARIAEYERKALAPCDSVLSRSIADKQSGNDSYAPDVQPALTEG
jgi:hypothetical protein